MPKGKPLTPEELFRRKHEIADAAVTLFAEKGYIGASMRELAETLGMGKSSLYDFFRTKDEIITYALEQKVTRIIQQAQEIVCLDIPPDQRLYRMMELDLGFLRENQALIMLMNSDPSVLSRENQERMQKVRHEYQDMTRGVIEEGIVKGFFRKVDTLLAARLLTNSLVTVFYATRPTGSPEEMLHSAIDIFLKGLQTRNV